MALILVVDDEASIRETLAGVLEDEGYETALASSGEQALEMATAREFDAALVDVWLPGIDGLETLSKLMEMEARPEVVMISGHGNIETAVRATKLGAYDFLEKPLLLERTLLVLKNALEARRLRSENKELRQAAAPVIEIVGVSVPIKAVRQQIGLMAPANGRVLIYGESGAGKEIVARTIHRQSPRAEAPYVEVNCAAIPEDLIESVLFGHRKGAFPGATSDQEGKLRKADGGTLFLDEVGDMSLKTQSKLLRTLDEGRFTPLGQDEPVAVDVRVIAATNKNLEEEIAKGNFREDLFYRLNVAPFFMPPLRERKEDIPLLAAHFLREFGEQYGRRTRQISEEAIEVLGRYSWPGNVRELRNVIERMLIMNPTAHIFERKHLPPLVYRESSRRAGAEFSTLHEARAAYERDFILKKLEESNGNVTRAAELLGLERSHLYRKMRSLGIAIKET